MCPESSPRRAPRRWTLRSSYGELAFAGLAIAVVSGVALAVAYDPARPYDSLAWLLLANPAAAYSRSVHYWAGQIFLVLTIAHTWSHLSRWTETQVPRRMWWRVAWSLPLATFVMFSGFLLKGDAESRQALLLATALIERVPGVGSLVAAALFGSDGHRQILYVHHVATSSILVWLFTAEHARAVWPRVVSVVEALVPIALVSLFVTPALHDALDPVVKGPWYFLGLQEALHWSSQPIWLVAAGALGVLAIVRLPRLGERTARATKWALAAIAVAYLGLTVVGAVFRGENWSLVSPWKASEGAPRPCGIEAGGLGRWWGPSASEILAREVPVVLGRREGCLFCHAGMKGLSPSHRADAVGCAACHFGNPFSLDAVAAHAGMVLVPGNLASASRTCGTVGCHPSQVERVSRSLMATMAGVVSVDRAVFGERSGDEPARRSPEGEGGRVEALGYSTADSHLRGLCASCHLGAAKTAPGPVTEDGRGGGCLACHLQYSPAARLRPSGYGGQALPRVHANLSIAIEPGACFGCHSRSGRISTSYEGWNEISNAAGDPPPFVEAAPVDRDFGPGDKRRLADGRTFGFVAPDIHARSMTCVDCHTAREVMGDGTDHAREYEAVRIACEDCHSRRLSALDSRLSAASPALTVTVEQLDSESRKIAELRGRIKPGERFVVTSRGGDALMNTSIDAQGVPWLTAKTSGRRLPMKPPAAVCVAGAGHARLSCISCHGVWAPRCVQCHTSFDPRGKAIDLLDGRTTNGAWVETAGEFKALPPTLGIVAVAGADGGVEVVDTFIPGMVITLDRNREAGARPDVVFRRLYARAFSHTVGQSARSCQSCHADPVALGYGEGALRYERDGDHGRWRFTPRFPPGPDGLPSDAWTGFLQERSTGTSTRPDVRPFTIEEQKRILTVGACLTCHEPSSVPMRNAVTAWRATSSRVTAKCLVPAW